MEQFVYSLQASRSSAKSGMVICFIQTATTTCFKPILNSKKGVVTDL